MRGRSTGSTGSFELATHETLKHFFKILPLPCNKNQWYVPHEFILLHVLVFIHFLTGDLSTDIGRKKAVCCRSSDVGHCEKCFASIPHAASCQGILILLYHALFKAYPELSNIFLLFRFRYYRCHCFHEGLHQMRSSQAGFDKV